MTIHFERIVHADWSTSSDKRWSVTARRESTGRWLVEAPRQVGSLPLFVEDLCSGEKTTLAGFDFPIGVPASYGEMTGLSDFVSLFDKLGRGDWKRFFMVSEEEADISIYRPFYPRVSSSKVKQVHLLNALGLESMDKLRRRSERATPQRRAACSLFWTLGGNQVGKAALSGWREVIQPARQRGAALWPFDGELALLSESHKLVLAETYPGEAYSHIGIRFQTGMSKQRRDDRLAVTQHLAKDLAQGGVAVTPEMAQAISGGFGSHRDGEDRFDAAVGLLGMIQVVEGHRAAMPLPIRPETAWEGWIMGQED